MLAPTLDATFATADLGLAPISDMTPALSEFEPVNPWPVVTSAEASVRYFPHRMGVPEISMIRDLTSSVTIQEDDAHSFSKGAYCPSVPARAPEDWGLATHVRVTRFEPFTTGITARRSTGVAMGWLPVSTKVSSMK